MKDCSRLLAQKVRVSSVWGAVLTRKTAHDRWLKDIEFRGSCEAVLVKKTAHVGCYPNESGAIPGRWLLVRRVGRYPEPSAVTPSTLFVTDGAATQ